MKCDGFKFVRKICVVYNNILYYMYVCISPACKYMCMKFVLKCVKPQINPNAVAQMLDEENHD